MAQIKYNRLIALGCSHTYGHGLEDCFVPPSGFSATPSKLSWSSQLAKLMNIESVVNLSKPGCSNKYILHSALNFNYKSSDLVVVLWTYNDRTGIFLNRDHYETIAHWVGTKYSNKFIKNFYSEHDLVFQNSVYINYFNMYTKELNLNYFYDFIDHSAGENFSLIKDNRFIDVDFNSHLNKYGKALDNSHMNSLGHRDLAKLWYEKVQAS